MEAASAALLRLVCQTIFVTCHNEVEALSKQQPDPAMRQSYVPQQLCRLQTCKRLLIAMQVSVAWEHTQVLCPAVYLHAIAGPSEFSSSTWDAALALIASSITLVLYSIQDPCTIQVAAYIGDLILLNEGAIRFENCAAPLLAAKANHGLLRKALAACHVALTETRASNAVDIQV